MVTVDDVLVDALPTEMLEDFVDAVNAVEDSLEDHKRKRRNNERHSVGKEKRKD